MSTNFVALYRGATVCTAKQVEVSADPGLVELVTKHLLREKICFGDPTLDALENGRRRAVKKVQKEASRDRRLTGGFQLIQGGAKPRKVK